MCDAVGADDVQTAQAADDVQLGLTLNLTMNVICRLYAGQRKLLENNPKSSFVPLVALSRQTDNLAIGHIGSPMREDPLGIPPDCV